MESSSRRNFLKQTGKIAGITGLVGGMSAGMAGCPPPSEGEKYVIPAWPWTYGPLDVEHVRKLGHQSYYTGGCCYGAFDGIVRALVEALGDPFDKVITDMMRYGGGGVAGFGSLCGTLNGAAAAIGLVCDKATQSKLVAELMSWYAATELPTDISNEYARDHAFYVTELKTDEWLTANAAGGNLCHMSVTNWCIASGHDEKDVQRAERCARLTGDVAAKAVELLNANYAGTFVAEQVAPSASASCFGCHAPDSANALTQTNGKMDCDLCHGPHEF